MKTAEKRYAQTADTLVARIVALGAKHRQEILDLTDVWDLYHVDGFTTDGLDPSLFQAMWALRKAQGILRAG